MNQLTKIVMFNLTIIFQLEKSYYVDYPRIKDIAVGQNIPDDHLIHTNDHQQILQNYS